MKPINQFKLLLYDNILCCSKKAKNHKLVKLYRQGQHKIESATDIEKVIKDIKDLRTYMHSFFVKKDQLFLIEHNRKNIIHLDSSLDNDSSSDNVIDNLSINNCKHVDANSEF